MGLSRSFPRGTGSCSRASGPGPVHQTRAAPEGGVLSVLADADAVDGVLERASFSWLMMRTRIATPVRAEVHGGLPLALTRFPGNGASSPSSRSCICGLPIRA